MKAGRPPTEERGASPEPEAAGAVERNSITVAKNPSITVESAFVGPKSAPVPILAADAGARIAGLLDAVERRPRDVPASRGAASVRQDRASDPRRGAARVAFTLLFLAAGLHAGARTGFLGAPADVSPGRFEARSAESRMRPHPNPLAVASAAALSIAAATHAQDAVQWRTEDGGNGHWYQLLLTGPISWNDARSLAESIGGHLATPTSSGENQVVVSVGNDPRAWINDCCGNAGGPWIGGFQPSDASPAAPWRWVTGEPWTWTGWAPGEPNNGFDPGNLVTALLGYPPLNQSYRGWADAWPSALPLLVSCIVEWSADCNGDGVVDYGQLRAGDLADLNGNFIPDCCEDGSACACDADVTGNRFVDPADLAAVLSAWGSAPNGKSRADVNQDGSIDAADLSAVLFAWGPCP